MVGFTRLLNGLFVATVNVVCGFDFELYVCGNKLPTTSIVIAISILTLTHTYMCLYSLSLFLAIEEVKNTLDRRRKRRRRPNGKVHTINSSSNSS